MKIVTALIACIFTSSAYAAPDVKCPAPHEIANAPIIYMSNDGNGIYYVELQTKTGTMVQQPYREAMWSVFIAVKAENEEMATQKTREMLRQIQYLSGPRLEQGKRTPPITYVCNYQNTTGMLFKAHTLAN